MKYIIFFLLLSFLQIIGCGLYGDIGRNLAQRNYINGREAENRILTSALIGYVIYTETHSDKANIFAPILGVEGGVRIQADRDYLETSVESCAETFLIANATGQGIKEQLQAGLFCNLGPGKRAEEI